MDVRVWGVVEDRLIELRCESAGPDLGFGIVGLPQLRTRSTTDRVRAALVNSGLVREAPAVIVRLEPAVQAGTTSVLDLPIAVAALVHAGAIRDDLGWILASGRLGLDGSVFEGRSERTSVKAVVDSLCQTRVLRSEHMFEVDET